MIVTAALAAVVALAVAVPSALGASTHPFKEEWTAPGCTIRDLATDAAGNVYVACSNVGTNEKIGSVRKFSPTGTAIPFTASVPYVSGNEINENPANSQTGQFGSVLSIDVDKSSARPGFIYVSSAGGGAGQNSESVEVFAPSGEYQTSLLGEFFTGESSGVGLDQDGFVYTVSEGCCGRAHMSKYDPTSFHEVLRLVPFKGSFGENAYNGACCIRIRPDSTGAIWVGWGGIFGGGTEWFGKWEADQFSTNITAGEKDPSTVVATSSPFLKEAFPTVACPAKQAINQSAFECSLKGFTFDVDLANDDVYANEGTRIVPYSNGIAGDPVHQNGPAFGVGKLTSSRGTEIAPNGDVIASSSGGKVVVFSKGDTLPTVTTKETPVTDIGHTTAFVRGIVDPASGGEITDCKVKFGTTTEYLAGGSPASCKEVLPYPGGSTTEVTAELTGLSPGTTYNYRFEAANAKGSNIGGNRRLEAKAVLDLETKPATEIDESNATLNGQLDADGLATEYLFEYGPSASYGLKTPKTPIAGAPGEIKSTPVALGHLQRGKTYHFRLVATNALGTTKGADVTFRTASSPDILGTGVENVTDTSADLHATINPVGYDSTYEFKFGTTPSLGQSLPLPLEDNELFGNTPQNVSVHLSGLPPATTIHYRVVATNEWGTSTTDDTTFNFRPPSCPNSHVRQLTGSSYVPDCRAYEIVSPGNAGAVQLMPGEGFTQFAETFGGSEFAQSPQNSGSASSPARFVYWGALGSITGIEAANSLIDVYTATRTTTGWVTAMPGLKGSETKYGWGRACSESLDLCVDHIGPLYVQNAETFEYETIPKSNSPFMYKADGTRIGRLPTNVNVVKNGTKYRGDEKLSGDFNHYFFSTRTKFTADGQEAIPGSVYDNDLGPKTVEVISKLPGGEPIPVQPAVAADQTRVTGLVGTSPDGSHVLLAGTTSAACDVNKSPFECPYMLNSPARLYLRVNNITTYEVSRGQEVNYVGMTKDASKVFFTTTKALDEVADLDTSRDLYMWEEQGDKLTLISQEGALGNTDACTATWTTKCGVLPLTPIAMQFSEYFDLRAHVPGMDDVLANESGDIYFYSPEDLVAGKVGGDGERNLYLYRDGQLHFVTTFQPGTQIERITISQDGSNAAFMTKSTLTSYDSKGAKEVFSYNANIDALRCASCNPSGAAPFGDTVSVAEAGGFMANDGRTFFATKESLVPQDTNGLRDIYEYVDGRAQLISTGTGDRESTGGLEVISVFFGNLQTSLESVSRDGVDVYFSTFESLVPEDKNGSFLKIYDARTGGGFAFDPDLGPCAAADECHGQGTTPPSSARIATGVGLGTTGNLSQKAKKKKKKNKKKQKKNKRHSKKHSKRQGSHRNG
jgi:hypothetical protein